METINIITRCTRQNNLMEISKTITNNLFKINWYVLFDSNGVKEVDTKLLADLTNVGCIIRFINGTPNDYGYGMINTILDEISKGWIYILDDDNIMHENFYGEINKSIIDNQNKRGFIFNQKVNGLDFTGLDIRIAVPENVKIGGIDVAQFLLHRDLIGNYRFNSGYIGDGQFITKLYPENVDEFIFIDKELCYYNYFDLKKKTGFCLPRILLIGVEEPIEMFSIQNIDYESKELVVKQIKDDTNLDSILQSFNPDSIVTIGENFNNFPVLASKHFDIRRKWIHLQEIPANIGDIAYKVASNAMLTMKDENNPFVSFFSPIYNTGDRLWRTYESLRLQTFSNWEWVMVNDSTDGGKTLLIAEQIANLDCRVKVYDFKKKSGGIIGESKYRAACLCNGDYLMELDHDDYLLPEAAYWMVEAFKKYPEAKFVYSDCAEVKESGGCIVYPDGFCFGYGSYRKETFNGVEYDVMNTADINPKTIRHIVGVPNHFRAWERTFYHSIGGHNRHLTIADDYELIVRTFLKTRMVRIPKLLYLQFYHSNNTQNQTRADIQRRVKTIREYYNYSINKRFVELGVKDWAFDTHPEEPLWAESKIGSEQSAVNYTFKEQETQSDIIFDKYGLNYII